MASISIFKLSDCVRNYSFAYILKVRRQGGSLLKSVTDTNISIFLFISIIQIIDMNNSNYGYKEIGKL